MIDFASILTLDAVFGGVLAMVITTVLGGYVVPQDEGAGQPQAPWGGREFKSDSFTFWTWITVECTAFVIGAVLGRPFGARLRETWQQLAGVEAFIATFVLTLFVLWMLRIAYESDVYNQ